MVSLCTGHQFRRLHSLRSASQKIDMYDIKQFKPTLYCLVLLGLIGFSLAAESMPLLLFSVASIGLNSWLVMTGRFSPLPRWLANLLTILALVYVLQQIFTAHGPPLMFIGQFLVLLQI